MGSVGNPHPEAAWGEVIGPPEARSRRCYTPAVAGALAGRSERWARQLVSDSVVDGYREAGGWNRVFLDAESFESLGGRRGWWPPAEPDGKREWQELASSQERDLDVATARIKELAGRISSLEARLRVAERDRDEALSMVESLASMAKGKRPNST